MSKVIQFKKEENCPICDLVSEFMEDVAESESPEELFSLLAELALISNNTGTDEGFERGFDIGHKVGYKDALESDMEIKKQIIADIEEELDNDTACDCDECTK
ncbi:hypothetical protein [Bacillus sp. UMB0728]|uniref:hypothetical protein n=1 Tax=Bacillus sp. UMB0728 TaxID=2066052 RepID=UPI000C7758AA|nr:hypothetical protein [Bacillus sp. UMB0728]PLR72304.1 hypothetical protein CYJ37_12160 [Bacillus sp. UMB0728]